MRILILEDSFIRIEKFMEKLQRHVLKITDKPKELIDWLKNDGPWDYIFLDYDLGTEETGYEIAKYISRCPEVCPKKVLIHSTNPVGTARMIDTLKNVGIKAAHIPMLWEKINI